MKAGLGPGAAVYQPPLPPGFALPHVSLYRLAGMLRRMHVYVNVNWSIAEEIWA